jgi:hypothetical protein
MSVEKKALRSAKWIQSKAEQIYDVLSGDFDQRHGSTLSQIKKRLRAGESPTKIRKSIEERNPTNPNVLLRGRQRTSWPHLKEDDSKRSEAVEMHDGGMARKTRVF